MVTNARDEFSGCIDYIFHSSNLTCVSNLRLPTLSELHHSGCSSLPTEQWGSDHLLLCAELAWRRDMTEGSAAVVEDQEAA